MSLKYFILNINYTFGSIRYYSTALRATLAGGPINKNSVDNKNKSLGWQYFTLTNLNIFVKTDFNQAFDKFWSAVMSEQTKVIGLLVKIKGEDGTILTLGPLFKFTKSDRSLLRKVLMEYINIKGASYSVIDINSVIFQYKVFDSNVTTNIPSIESKKVKSYKFERLAQ